MPTFSFFLLWLVNSVLAQDQWRLVYQDGEVVAAWGAPRLSAVERSHLQFAWAWSELRPPRRLEPAAIETAEKLALPAAGRLQIRVALPGAAAVREGGGATCGECRRGDTRPRRPPLGATRSARSAAGTGLSVIAAPIEMWRDLPEDRLPTWTVPASGRLAVPHDPAHRWRVRLRGEQQGSWWIDVPVGRSAVLLAPAPAAGIDLMVTGPDDRPVPTMRGTLLEGATRAGGNRAWANVRGESGRLAVPGLPDLDPVTLTVMASGFAPATVRGRPGELPRKLRLGAGAKASGRVTSAAGTPLAGADVRVEAWMAPNLPLPLSLGMKTPADGTWLLLGLPPGRAVLRISAPGFVPVREPLELAAGSNDLGARALAAARTVAVLAVDEEGTPVAGANVDGGTGTLAISDARGLALVTGLPTAPLALTARAPGHRTGNARYNPPFAEPLSVTLPRAMTLRGRLMESTGVPASEGSFRIEQPSCFSQDRLADGGRFEQDVEPGQAVTLVLRSPATRELRRTLPAGSPGEVRDLGDLLAPPSLAVAGRVASARDGLPVTGARVWLPRPGPDGPAVAWGSRDLLTATSDEEGRFRLSGLAPGAAVLRVEAAGFARAHLEVSLVAPAGSGDAAAGSASLAATDVGTIALSAGATLRVLVRGARAAAIEAPQEAVARADLRNEWLEPDMLTAPVADGVATLRNVPAGTATVSVLAGRKLLCEQQVVVVEGDERDVDCAKPALTVAGLVLVGGKPAGAGTLIWQVPDAGAASRIDTIVSPGGLQQQQVFGAGRPQVDVQVPGGGTFATEELTPGRWQVAWVPEQGSFATTAPQLVDIPAVETFDTVLSYPGLALAGVVTYEDGRTAERARVRELVSGALAFSAADGSFALAGLKPGKAAVEAQLLELSSAVADTSIDGDHPPEPLHLVLKKRSPPSIEVRVLGADGIPLPGVFVFLEEEGKGRRILTTDAEGKTSAALEPPMAPRVRPAAATGSGWILGGWVATAQARDEGLTLQSAPAGSLLLTSTGKGGSPRIVSEDGWDLSWLLRQLGTAPLLTPERPLRLDGLPVGRYSITLERASLTVAVSADAPAEARLE